ncbi:hypothetical protein TraAM80_00890 [Trypanosoma rangeli]|uniref:Uncharacterized protein n=1 Tax=Trypanosoma rangeli TaxID=5698 RepID=A0A3S5ISI4_TRYRA|nr:uncharacterized protein TraAM80_00890 [Trypanosoma rangeli]RNF11444.1 hypothetical protein TraAM80_00890 [Trypanosoma rangeli]|eukprot:RNF11444.1 hypothetical protein TraAM80_00890 [Trypanosoma rangeli]
MRQTSVKLLHSKRHEIKQRMLQQNVLQRNRLRQAELGECRAGSTEDNGSVKDAYVAISKEFQCDVGDPAVMELLLDIEEEIRNELLMSLFEESQDEDWEAYYNYLLRP